ncbi:class I SAM-dependent methyltransferase [Rhodopirellula bahusiensis]|nr:class I SAM-dependent methyltransferase [Rhodopirellula bahusiensis]
MIEIANILEETIAESNDLSPSWGEIKEYNEHMRYRYRLTLDDITSVGKQLRVLEIGAFTGVVSVSLKKMGYSVTAHDIPFIVEDKSMKHFLVNNNVECVGLDLQDTVFPIQDEKFDLIVFNEVLEHLCFNAIPLLREFNRLLDNGGRVYCATPNLACLRNRVYLSRGKGFLSPISSLLLQLQPGMATSVGLHWREWTKDELVELFNASGFHVDRHWYRQHIRGIKIRNRIVNALYTVFPALQPGQVGVFKKD